MPRVDIDAVELKLTRLQKQIGEALNWVALYRQEQGITDGKRSVPVTAQQRSAMHQHAEDIVDEMREDLEALVRLLPSEIAASE